MEFSYDHTSSTRFFISSARSLVHLFTWSCERYKSPEMTLESACSRLGPSCSPVSGLAILQRMGIIAIHGPQHRKEELFFALTFVCTSWTGMTNMPVTRLTAKGLLDALVNLSAHSYVNIKCDRELAGKVFLGFNTGILRVGFCHTAPVLSLCVLRLHLCCVSCPRPCCACTCAVRPVPARIVCLAPTPALCTLRLHLCRAP
jgi:hypothetical protein